MSFYVKSAEFDRAGSQNRMSTMFSGVNGKINRNQSSKSLRSTSPSVLADATDCMDANYSDSDDENLDDSQAQTQLQIELLMQQWQREYCTYDNCRIFAGTFNVNNKITQSTESIQLWLGKNMPNGFVPHIYVIGFQEVDTSAAVYIGGQTPREQEWATNCIRALHPSGNYMEISRVRLASIYLLVYVETSYAQRVKVLGTCSVPTGQWEILGNKGGVAVSLRVNDTFLCIVNSHLAAGNSRADLISRNMQHSTIMTKTLFKPSFAAFSSSISPKTFDAHDGCIWVGDLNYRLALIDNPGPELSDAEFVHKRLDNIMLRSMSTEKRVHELLVYDELKQMQSRSWAFSAFEEPPILFIPTYKFDAGTSSWDSSEKQRAPAYCDRILYKDQDAPMSAAFYESIMDIYFSDHKPVRAGLNVRVKTIDDTKRRSFRDLAMKEADKRMNEALPQVALSNNDVDFGLVKYLEPVMRAIRVRNVGQVPCEFKFNKKPGYNRKFKPWLTVMPNNGRRVKIQPGKEVLLEMQVCVNKADVASLNDDSNIATIGNFDDMLIMHLIGGRDHFIALQGKFSRTSFGRSIADLVNPAGNSTAARSRQELLIQFDEPDVSPSNGGALDYPNINIPRQIWLLVEHCKRQDLTDNDLSDTALCFSQEGFSKLRDYLDSNQHSSKLPKVNFGVAFTTLLRFLEALRDPVIPEACHKTIINHVTNHPDHDKIYWEFVNNFDNSQLTNCGPHHRLTFAYLICFLRGIIKHSAHNGTSVEWASNVFTEYLFLPFKQQILRHKAAFFIQRCIVTPIPVELQKELRDYFVSYP